MLEDMAGQRCETPGCKQTGHGDRQVDRFTGKNRIYLLKINRIIQLYIST